MFPLCEHDKCTGCAACAASCPKGCIGMLADGEGFLHPVINKELCVDCGICSRVCPVKNHSADDGTEPKCFAARANDADVLKNASSGGVFSLLAASVIERGGAVFGAAFGKDFSVAHEMCSSPDGLSRLTGSKYVQSDVSDSYKAVREALDGGKEVLFTGTPCQIAGLKAYLGEDSPLLFTADLICHGAPSPAVWRSYLSYREGIAGAKASSVSFRDKRSGWKRYSLTIGFANGKEYSAKLTDDMYMRAYLQDATSRESCAACPFRQVHRAADLTMADFWGAESAVPEYADDRGVSLLMVHSAKGEELVLRIADRAKMTEVSFRDAVAHNRSATESCAPSPVRRRFIAAATRGAFDRAWEKYCGNGFVPRIRRRISKLFNK